MKLKEESIRDLKNILAESKASVAEKEKKLEELEEGHSKLAELYEKDNNNIKKYNQELITKHEASAEEIKQCRLKLTEKEKIIETLKAKSTAKPKRCQSHKEKGVKEKHSAPVSQRLSNRHQLSLQLSRKERKARKEMKERKEMKVEKEQEKERTRSKEKKAKVQDTRKEKNTTKYPNSSSAAMFGNSTQTLRSTSVSQKQKMEQQRSKEQISKEEMCGMES